MIHLNFDYSKDPSYLGLREFNRNSLTLGPEGLICIEDELFPYPEISIKIQNNKLVFQVESGEYYIKHNGKRSRLPIVASIGDKIEIENFKITVVNFKNLKYTSYRNFTSQALQETQSKPELMKLISRLTSFLD